MKPDYETTLAQLKDLDKGDKTYVHLGSFDADKEYKETDAYKLLKYVFENKLDSLKRVKWKDISKLQSTRLGKFGDQMKLNSYGMMQHQSYIYNHYLPFGYTQIMDPERNIKGQMIMDFMNHDGEYESLAKYSNFEGLTCDQNTDYVRDQLGSFYYHAAKGHWLIHNLQKEGLWFPIQGQINKNGDSASLQIHPGSIRTPVFELLNDDNLEVLLYNDKDMFPDVAPLELDEYLEQIIEEVDIHGSHSNISFAYSMGYIETNLSLQSKRDFRKEVYDFNKKVSEQVKGKRVTIYIGYDSRHSNLAEQSKALIERMIEKNTSCLGGVNTSDPIKAVSDWKPEVKLLDISKIPEYTREYANQSTEFTYSRFLIPHLENYEGYSIFVDDDYIFRKSILPFFLFLNPDDAVACVQYDFDNHGETKFDGEKNVSYPKKLWSSFMVFNNGHEDCKKLTPETVNSESGKYLHQFEWTDKISKIPDFHFVTEGYDHLDDKPQAFAIHYTRGGPWIKDMDTSNINMLNIYDMLTDTD
jgi:hypothetical protein